MVINLQKGQRISLKKEAPSLSRVMLGLGWDVAKSQGGLFGIFSEAKEFDLDSSVLCLDANGRIQTKEDVIYFSNLRHRSGAITHLGDNLTGAGEGDDEQIIVDLPDVPPEIVKLVFVVNIYNALDRQQDFGEIKNAFVRLVDVSNNKEIARYNLSGEEYRDRTGMIMAEIDRDDGGWQMQAIGRGVRVANLEELTRSYS
ncbi:MAG: TerD family protein [Prochloraceae cyanobacterium]|nr:TerD family protein [Prochloraceae cyanobacterium]